jgi:adenylate cyclase class 2
MKYEVEQKFRVSDLAQVEELVTRCGGAWGDTIVQVDTYFRHPARDFEVTDEALRIRRVNDQCCITYKGPKIDATTKTRRELELPLPREATTYDDFCELLEALGFQRVADVRKRRKKAHLQWLGKEVEIALDSVELVGDFVELEVAADVSTLDAARQCVAQLAQRLNLSGNERRSYLELQLNARTCAE